MQNLDWNDLKLVLTVSRDGSVARAAEALGLHETTVTRRLTALSTALGMALFEGRGRAIAPTEAATALIRAAEQAENAISLAEEEVSGSRVAISGTVTVTAVPRIANQVLIPAIPTLAREHPALTLHIIPSGQDLGIVTREADIALRFGITQSEPDVRARKIASVRYGIFGRTPDQPWITYGGRLSSHPPAVWTEREMRRAGQQAPALIVEDADAMAAAITVGVGRGFLPDIKGGCPSGTQRLKPHNDEWQRPLWLLTHPDGRNLARVRAVADWLETVVGAAV